MTGSNGTVMQDEMGYKYVLVQGPPHPSFVEMCTNFGRFLDGDSNSGAKEFTRLGGLYSAFALQNTKENWRKLCLQLDFIRYFFWDQAMPNPLQPSYTHCFSSPSHPANPFNGANRSSGPPDCSVNAGDIYQEDDTEEESYQEDDTEEEFCQQDDSGEENYVGAICEEDGTGSEDSEDQQWSGSGDSGSSRRRRYRHRRRRGKNKVVPSLPSLPPNSSAPSLSLPFIVQIVEDWARKMKHQLPSFFGT